LQGEFYHWVPLFNYFDEFLEKTVKQGSQLELRFEEHESSNPPFPADAVVAVLRTTTIILENCANKHFWASYEVCAGFGLVFSATCFVYDTDYSSCDVIPLSDL
jgi:hypothetical protein